MQALYATDETAFATLTDLVQIRPGGVSSQLLIDAGPVKQTLMALDEGQRIRPHKAAGTLTVQVLSGRLSFGMGGQFWEMHVGDWVLLKPFEVHEVSALEPVVCLLTFFKPEAEGSA